MGRLWGNAVVQQLHASNGWDFAAGRQQIWGLLKQRGRPEKQYCYVQSNYSIPLITTCKGILGTEMFSDMNPINYYLCM